MGIQVVVEVSLQLLRIRLNGLADPRTIVTCSEYFVHRKSHLAKW